MERSVEEIKARTAIATKYRGFRSICNLMTAVTTEVPTPQFMMHQINAAHLYLKEPYETTDHDAAQMVYQYIIDYKPGGVPDDYNGIITHMDEVEKQHYDEMRLDYRKLFGNETDPRLSPFESFYTADCNMIDDGEGHQTNSVVLAIEAFLAANDMEARSEFGVAADHIAVECGFLAYTSEKIMRALVHFADEEADQWKDLLASFLIDHTLNYGPLYFENVAKLAQTDYYRGMALLGKGALDDMAAELDISPAAPAPDSFRIVD